MNLVVFLSIRKFKNITKCNSNVKTRQISKQTGIKSGLRINFNSFQLFIFIIICNINRERSKACSKINNRVCRLNIKKTCIQNIQSIRLILNTVYIPYSFISFSNLISDIIFDILIRNLFKSRKRKVSPLRTNAHNKSLYSIWNIISRKRFGNRNRRTHRMLFCNKSRKSNHKVRNTCIFRTEI